MTVKLDLRIPGKYKIKLDEPENSFRHYLLFSAVAAFFLIVSSVLLLGSWKVYSINAGIKKIEARKSSIIKNTELMDKELVRLTGEADLVDQKLDFVLADIPSIEVMIGLDRIMPEGLVLDSLVVSQGQAMFKGTALDEEDIMLFVDRLTDSKIVLSVEVPVIKNSKMKQYNVKTFSITCKLRTMREILHGNIFLEPAAGNISGDEAL